MLELVNLDEKISKEVYQQTFPNLEIRLGEIQREARSAGVPVVIVFEGWEAAGKGTLINRLTQALDPRGFKVHPISAPSETERFYPWLRRFWTALPAAGSFALFDRSWYGRVLVERVEGFATPEEWERAYATIVGFERTFCIESGVLVKFWLHVSDEEQLHRFKKREKTPLKSWKMTDEDWRNSEKRPQYVEAIEDMVDRTDHAHAPWQLVEGDDKRYARVKVIETAIAEVERGMREPGSSAS